MLRDVEPFERVWRTLRGDSLGVNAIVSFVQFLEEKFGAQMFYDVSRLPSPETSDLLEIAERMREAGILLSYGRSHRASDEPPLIQWNTRYREGDEGRAAGASVNDERQALVSALAESLERYLWWESSDYFQKPMVATVRQLEGRGTFTRPESFASFSDAQRQENPHLLITPERVYQWIRGYSFIHKGPVWIPAQIVSPHQAAQRLVRSNMEPVIRQATTTGLATHPAREQALLSGALEIIERDAYMIMWLNQLTLPRVELESLARKRPSLRVLLERCRRYRLRPHVVRMLTDAPAHAFCAVVEDETDNQPRIAIGLKAHGDAATCAEKAIIEALRGRRGARNQLTTSAASDSTQSAPVGHYDRLAYWANNERSKKLDFLYAGPVEQLAPASWDEDSAQEHLDRIVQWCASNTYEFATVSLTKSAKNVTNWHIEMVVIPQLQPIHYMESRQYIGGSRLETVPRMLGYSPRTSMFTDEPHPFA